MEEPPDHEEPEHEEPDREDGKAPCKPPKPVLEPRNKPKTPVHTAGFPSPTGPGTGASGIAKPTHEHNSPQKTAADEKKDRMAAMLQKSDEQMAKSIQGLENEHKRDRARLAAEYEDRPEDEMRKAMDDLQEKQQEQMDLTIENLERDRELGAERIRMTEDFNKAHDDKSMGRDGR